MQAPGTLLVLCIILSAWTSCPAALRSACVPGRPGSITQSWQAMHDDAALSKEGMAVPFVRLELTKHIKDMQQSLDM